MRFVLISFFFFLFSCSGNQNPAETTVTDTLQKNISPPDTLKKDSGTSYSRPFINSTDDLAKLVFAAVKSSKVEDYLILLPTMEEITELVTNAKLDDDTKKKSIEQFPEKRKEEIVKAKDLFAKTIQVASDSGIFWNKTSYYTTQANVQTTPAGFDQALTISIIFAFNQKYFEIALGDCIKTVNGWRVSSRIRYDGAPKNPVK